MKQGKRFEVIQAESVGAMGMRAATVLLDKLTGVQYLYFTDGAAGGLTALLDRDGKPIAWDPEA